LQSQAEQAAVERWLEQGRAPQELLAALRVAGALGA